jgi:predicted DNA-binding protein
MRKNKDVEIQARVTRKMRSEIASLADQRGETISLIVREAIREYLAKKRHQ